MQKRDSFIKQFLQLATGTMINMLIGVFTTPIITRLVEPNEYGKISIFNTYSSIALMVFTIGLDQAFIRYYYTQDNDDYKRKLLRICISIPIVLGIIGSVIIIGVEMIYPDSFGLGNTITICFVLNIFILIFNRFGMLVLRLKYKTKLYSMMNIIHKVLYVVLVIPCVLLVRGYDVYILVFATLGSVLVPTLISILCEKRSWFGKGLLKNVQIDSQSLIKFGLPLMISSGVFILFQAMDKLCVKYYGTYSDVGVYSSAQSLMAVFAIIQSTFNTLWAPKAIEQYEKNKEDVEIYSRMNRIITILMFTFGSCVLLFKDVFVLLLGEKYRTATSIIPFLMFNPIMYTVSETTVVGLNITKHTKCQMIITGASCVVNFCGNMLLIPIMGLKGAAVSTGISYILFFTLRTVFANHYFKVPYQLGKFYILTVAFVGFCTYSMFNSFDYWTVIISIVIFVLILILYRDDIKYSVEVVKKLLHKKIDVSVDWKN